jgi:hypothetical protein
MLKWITWTEGTAEPHQRRQKVIGGTAGPIMRPISRNSQLRSIPAALNIQDRPPVCEQEAKAQEHTPGEGE